MSAAFTEEKNKGKIFRGIENLECSTEYPDEFYCEYLESFSPNTKKRLAYRFFKRLGDIFTALLALALLWPVFLVIAIMIRCDSKGPIFFRQKRIGRYGREFVCVKFRSMRIDAPKNAPTALLENPQQYYTKVGQFLRRTSLDELPQLFCVLVGTMSIISYRPLIPEETKANNMRAKLGVFDMRPGISGLAQVMGRDDVYYKNKAILDAEYVKNASIRLDMHLIFRTIAVVLRGHGNKS